MFAKFTAALIALLAGLGVADAAQGRGKCCKKLAHCCTGIKHCCVVR